MLRRKLYKNPPGEQWLSTAEAAKLLGISRVHVVRLIRSGAIRAERVGRTYVLPKDQFQTVYRQISQKERTRVEEGVARVIREYGETIRLLGNA